LSGFQLGEGLTHAQHEAVLEVLKDGAATGFEPLEMTSSSRLEAHVHLLDQACPDDAHLQALASNLTNMVRWYRAPAYFLTNAFQHLTQRRASAVHAAAALLFADAQMASAEDLAFHSTEVAWRALRALQAEGRLMPDGWLEDQQQVVLHRLRTQYRFYARWTRPFDYLECNPLTEHMYDRRVLRDLRETYPDQTDLLSSAMPPIERAAVLLEVAASALTSADTYHWLTARRFAASELEGVGRKEDAEQAYRLCLEDARAVGLEAEIGHLLRSHGWNLMQLGRLDEAAEAMEQAIQHEQPLSLFGYWAALAARELGQIRYRMGSQDSLDAYREGRRILDMILVSGGPPAGASIKRQMLRSYADNALINALVRGQPADALAEIEAAGPRSVGETQAEIRAAADLPAEDAAQFLRARAVFHQHLTSVPSTFETYLAEMDAQYASRRRYMLARQKMFVLSGRTSDQVAQRLLSRIGDDRLIVAFALGPRPTSCAVLLDLLDGSVEWVLLAGTEELLRRAHRTYAADLADAEGLVGASATEVRGRAVRDFCTVVQPVLEPVLSMLAQRGAGRRLVIVPQMQLHAVPFAALDCDGQPLLDVVADVATVPTLGILADLLEAEPQMAAGVTAFHSSEVPIYQGCMEALSETRHVRVLRDPSRTAALETLQAAAGDDVLFACHGVFAPDAPAASYLAVAPGVDLTLGDVTGSVMLPTCRTVILGACESGLARAELGSEFIGLAGALLGAGVPTVVAGLWRIDQIASTILIADVIARLAGAQDAPAALAAAQRRLRRMAGQEVAQWLTAHLPGTEQLAESFASQPSPFDQPVHWAGFAAAGVGPRSQ
jgi:tetratricopeptide (TPR) repeat protein